MKLSKAAQKILNDPDKITRRDQWFDRLQDFFNGNFPGKPMEIKGIYGTPQDGMLLYTNPEQWVIESLENLAEKIYLCDNDERFVPPCIEPGIFGVHFIDSLFGSHVFHDPATNQWNNRYLDSDVGTLHYPDLDNCEAWQTAKRTVQAFLQQDVALPLFGLPTIASALNIAVNLYGEKILLRMLAEPDNTAHDLSVINNVLVDLHRWYRSVLPQQQLQPVLAWERTQPPGYGQICGCTTQLIGAHLYETQIAPLDNELLGVYPHGGMIHLCGSHKQFIPAFRSMPNLKSIQINDRAAHDLALYFSGLRDDQIIYLMPCEGMPVETAIAITGGKRLVLQITNEQ